MNRGGRLPYGGDDAEGESELLQHRLHKPFSQELLASQTDLFFFTLTTVWSPPPQFLPLLLANSDFAIV